MFATSFEAHSFEAHGYAAHKFEARSFEALSAPSPEPSLRPEALQRGRRQRRQPVNIEHWHQHRTLLANRRPQSHDQG